jgi:hypothetical protein
MAVGFAAFAAGAQVVNTLATTGMSFSQMAEAKREMERANQEAATKVSQIYKELDVNVYEGLGLPKLADQNLARRAGQAYKTAMEAAGEADPRSAAATAGRTVMANQALLENQAAKMEERKFGLDKLIAAEDSRLRDLKVGVMMEEAAGAQLKAREAAEMKQKSMKEGFEGVTASLGAAASFVPLYQKTKAARLAKQALKRNPQLQEQLASQGMFGGVDTSGVGDMSQLQFQDFITDEDRFSIDQLKELRDKKVFVNSGSIMDTDNIIPGVGMNLFGSLNLNQDVSQELIDLLGFNPTSTSELATNPAFDRKIMFNPND